MSQQPRSPTSSPSSQPSSTTARKEDQPAQPDLTTRYAESDEDCWLIFTFLLRVAQPVLIGRLDKDEAMAEIMRIRDQGAPIMAFFGDQLVGVLGLTEAQWWYGPSHFLTDRWFFVLPGLKHRGVATALLAEAQSLAVSSGLPIVINGHMRMRGTGVFFTKPRVILPPDYRAQKH